MINQKLGYLVRCGDPDAIDSIVPMAYGNLALDLLLNRVHGRLVVLKNGRYDNMPIDAVIGLEEGRKRQGALQHRTAAPALQQLRNEAAVHYDFGGGLGLFPTFVLRPSNAIGYNRYFRQYLRKYLDS